MMPLQILDAQRKCRVGVSILMSIFRTGLERRPPVLPLTTVSPANGAAARLSGLRKRLFYPYLGNLEVNRVHDRTLEPFIADRVAAGVTATTINRSLEVVRTILNRSARSYRDDDGRPWLDALPPLITMLPETPRLPYPITWEEQDRLFPKLSVRLGRMALFAINTGLRESNVCGLEWAWEVPVPEVGRSVFVIPPEAFKSKRAHVVILNDAAWSIVRAQRGLDPIWVFPCRGQRMSTMNNTALGHANHSMAGHYASADVGRLLKQANLVLNRQETRTVLRVANAGASALWIKGPARVPQQRNEPRLRLVSP